MKWKISDVKKEIQESVKDIKQTVSEISNNLVQKGKTSIGAMVESFLKYYLYLLNEVSLGLFYLQTNQRKLVAYIHDGKHQIKDGVQKVERVTGLMKNLEQETREISDMNGRWVNSMSTKFKELGNEL